MPPHVRVRLPQIISPVCIRPRCRRITTSAAPNPTTTVPAPDRTGTALPSNLTGAQRAYITKFFNRNNASPRPLISVPQFIHLPHSTLSEVAFLGRSNVGKSSLLNALLGATSSKAKGKDELAYTSKKRGRTRAFNAYAVGGVQVADDGKKWVVSAGNEGGFVVMDLPGYGAGSRVEWGEEIMKYLKGRRQLRRTFVLIDAEHGLKQSDRQLLQLLQAHGVPYQLVPSKIDKVLFGRNPNPPSLNPERICRLDAQYEEIKQQVAAETGLGVGGLMDIVGTSAERIWPRGSGRRIGIEKLRWVVLQALGLDCDEAGKRRVVNINVVPKIEESESEDDGKLETNDKVQQTAKRGVGAGG